jgi:hypothetical protein
MRLEHVPRAFVPGERRELVTQAAGKSDRVTAARPEVRCGDQRAALERLAHGGNARAPHERHVGERHEVGICLAGVAHCAGEARAHALGRARADADCAAFRLEDARGLLGARTNHGEHAMHLGSQMARSLHGDRHAVRQRMLELVGTEA